MSELNSGGTPGKTARSSNAAFSAVAFLALVGAVAGGFLFWRASGNAGPGGSDGIAMAAVEDAGPADRLGAEQAVDPFLGTDDEKPEAEKPEAKPEKPKKGEDDEVEYPLKNRLPIPENIFDGGKGWLNTSGDIRLKDLKGKVVVLDFWTYCCINCMHVLPDLAFLEKKFPNELVVIGVHSAKFDNEKDSENIRRAIQRYNIEHPVVNDADMLIWRKFGVNSWPTLLVIDAEGNACFATSGEGKKEILDLVVTKLVEYHTATKTLDRTPIRFDLERQKMPDQPLKFPGKVLADEAGGRLFIADSGHNRIIVSDLDGKLIDVIGSGGIGAKDGTYDVAQFDHPNGMSLVGDLLYVADTENHLIRVVDLKKKEVTTLAGTGEQDRERTPGGKLRTTPLNSPWDVLALDGVLYIAMAGPHQIWSHKLGSDTIANFAGSGREDVRNGSFEESAFAQPSGLATDGKYIYIADSEGSAIRKLPINPEEKVTTIVGTYNLPRGQSLFAFGDTDGIGDEARLQHPIGVAWHDGKVYIADSYNHKIKRVTFKDDEAESKTWLGDVKAGDSVDPPRFNEPHGLSAAKGEMYIADTNNHRIAVADLESGAVSALTIEGLNPPKKPENTVADIAPKTVVEAKPQAVAAGDTLQLEFAVALPKGYKINTQGAVTARLKASGEQGLVAPADLDRRHAAKIEDDRILLTVPATGKPGSATFEVALSLTYCREGTGGVCKLGSLRWKAPVEATADAKEKSLKFEGRIE